MRENIVLEKSFAFAVRIVNMYKYLTEQKKEYIMSKQLLRCGTSIGANTTEAQRAQSKPDFISKMSIALKEAYETEYWLRLLNATEYIEENVYASMHNDNEELISLLVSICKTAKEQ
jgi:four helix bundle protein